MKILFLSMLIFIFVGCGSNETENDDRLRITATVFPQYDWAREIIGENADLFDLTFLINSGVDLHSFSPSVQDIARIKTSDVFIYVGGHSDGWVNAALADANPEMIVINLMDVLGIEDMVIEGVPCGDDCDEDHDHITEFTADEHVWLSLRNAGYAAEAIAAALAEIDPGNADVYFANLESYSARLAELDTLFIEAVEAGSTNTLLIADRFPFRYLLNDYGLLHFAAFAGCSAETEASFSTIVSLSTQLDRLSLNAVIVTESSDQSIARTVIENTAEKNQQVLILDSMQSVTANDAQNGTSYLSIMQSNLEVLRRALV